MHFCNTFLKCAQYPLHRDIQKTFESNSNELILFANVHNNEKFTAFNDWFLSSLFYVLRSDKISRLVVSKKFKYSKSKCLLLINVLELSL